MSFFAFDPELEQKLNDIDEFIKTQCGDLTSGFDQSEWLLPSQAGEAPMHASSCNLKAAEPGLLEPGCDGTPEELIDPYDADDSGPEVRVQILNLKENKSTKSVGDYDSQVGSSEVTIIVRAEEEIKRIRVYIQPCPETTTRSPDATGPVELRAHLQYYDHKQTVLSVDLNSFHKEQVTRTACRQSSTDIAERNLFELVIMVGLRTGNISTVKSKPFRIGIKSQQMVKDIEQDNSDPFDEGAQEVPSYSCEVVASNSMMDSDFPESFDESLDTNTVVNRVASKLRQELARLNLRDSFHTSPPVLRTDPLIFGKVVLRPDTTLDKKKVSSYYNRDSRARYVVEQPDLPVLLKLMSRTTTCTSGGRRRANGFKTAEEDFWWACGLCFFERRKKSTVKAHVAQRVCQKTSLRKEMRQRRKAIGHLKRYSSCEFNSERFEGFDQFTWNSPLSV